MRSTAWRRGRVVALGTFLAIPAALVSLTASPAAAASAITLYVRSGATGTTCRTSGSGACGSIGTAVSVAEGDAGDAVTVTIGQGTYDEHTIDVRGGSAASLRLQGAGPSLTTLTAQGLGRGILLTGEDVKTTRSVTVAGMTISGANAGARSYARGVGGGVLVATIGATFTDDAFSNDTATNGTTTDIGGGIAILNNAGIHFPGQPVTVSKTTFVRDTARDAGGAAYEDIAGGSATFSNDTFVDDSTLNTGGALNVAATQVATIRDSTFLHDTAGVRGGAVFSFGLADMTGSIIDQSSCSVLVIPTPELGPQYAGIISSAFDVSTTGGTCVRVHPAGQGGSNVVTTAAAIDLATALSTNGAPTAPPTLSIGPDSAAIDTVPAAYCDPEDERALPRPGDVAAGQTSCDAGAYELQHTATTLVQAAPSTGSLVAGGTTSFHLAVTNTSAATGTVTYRPTLGSLPSGVTVAPTGEIAVSASVTAGTYTLEGTDTDPLHDAGNWTFGLRVTKATPAVTWKPGPLTFGQPLGQAQLDASASVGGTPVPGTFTYTPPAGTVLQPGAHVLHAAFTPSTAADFTTATATTTVHVGFTQSCITTARVGALRIETGEAICVETGGSLPGPLTVEPGGALWMTGGSVTGPVTSNGAAAVTICGSAFFGPVTVVRTSGPLLMGAPGCAGNDFHGPVRVEGNTGGVDFVGNASVAPVVVTNNSGPFDLSGDTDRAPTRVDDNS